MDIELSQEKLNNEELKKIFETCTTLIKLIISSLLDEEDSDNFSPTLLCKMMFPFWMVKSIIAIRFIKLRVSFRNIMMPPDIVCQFIIESSIKKLKKIYLSGEACMGLYWLSDFRVYSYIGSSIRTYPEAGKNYCRMFSHFEHAIMHIRKIFHNCKQEILYDHMARNMEFWILLVFSWIDKNSNPKELRKIEDHFIAALKPNMNRKGNYRCKAKCSILSRVESRGRYNMSSTWRKKMCKIHVERSKKIQCSGQQTFFVWAKKSSAVYYNLCSLLDDCCNLEKDSIEVICKFGSPLTDTTSYDNLYHKYGKSMVSVGGVIMPFHTMVKKMLYGRKVVKFSLDISTICKKERNMGTDARALDNISLLDGLKLFVNRNSIKNKLNRAVSSRNIKGFMASKFGVFTQEVYRASLPSFVNVHKKSIGAMVYKCMLNVGIDKYFASFVSKRISISSRYESSIRSLMDNSNILAKKFRVDCPFKCSCEVIKAIGGTCGSAYGHLWIKSEDVIDTKIKGVLDISANSKPLAEKREKEEAIQTAVIDILKSSIKNWEEADTKWILSKDIGGFADEKEFLSVKEVKECAKNLKPCAISFRDKNRNSGHISCAFLFWRKTYEEYIEDYKSYEPIMGINESIIIERWVDWYKNDLQCCINLAPKSKWCIAGYGCIIFKNKDMLEGSDHYGNIRARAVVKAAHEGKVIPLKPALQVVNSCLNFAMRELKHYGMWMRRCEDLVDDVKKLTSKLRRTFGNSTAFVLNRYDIENFFPNVDWDSVYPAVRFFIDNEKFRNGFWVHKKNKKWVMSSKPKIDGNFDHLSVEQVKKLIIHEKENCFFLLGENMVMRQRKGIAIGGYISSALAILLANYAEHMAMSTMMEKRFMNVQGSDLLGGLRITDDGLVLITVDRRWQNHEKIAATILKKFISLFMSYTNILIR